ncbi:MAG TPA: MFS transporter [Chloroflexota bacterium]|nr:MFS transporter [Chloroflexota bacterium]
MHDSLTHPVPSEAEPNRSSIPPELPAAVLAIAAAVILIALIDLGSRQFRDFDSALIGYAVGTVFAVAAVTYRYVLWLGRPPTWRYFRAGWLNFLSWRNFRRYTALIPLAWWRDIFGQTFILKRSVERWIMHMAIFWGVVLSCLITFPLTFGWIRFTLVPPTDYELWFFGLPIFRFPIEAGTGFALFHALDFTAVLLIVGLAIALWRRVSNAGLLATQRFDFDLMPLVLLFAIAITGLALTASSLFWQGRFYWFISLTHQVVVVGWLLSLPFGKFFHIIERPASIGVTLYQTVNQGFEQLDQLPETCRCKRCGQALPSEQFVSDLKATLRDLRQDYDLGSELGWLQDYCPTCKRILRGEAYYQLLGGRFL